jgi:RNA polymerase sigma-70 factor (ECF subfamily)
MSIITTFLLGNIQADHRPQREVITLAYFGGHSHRQVAAILGAPLGTVKGRIREALSRLRLAMTSDD